MKILEKILAVGALIFLILKFSLISGSDLMTALTILILACIYYPLGFLFFNQIRLRDIFKKAAYQNVTVPKIIFAIFVGLALSAVCIGILFKLLNLSGADQMLLLGLTMTVVVFIISVILLLSKNGTNVKFILWRMCIIGGVGSLLLFTPKLSIVKFEYRNHPAYIEAYTEYMSDPHNENLRRKMELERHKITLTEQELKEYEK